jgi:hypothetical protein
MKGAQVGDGGRIVTPDGAQKISGLVPKLIEIGTDG